MIKANREHLSSNLRLFSSGHFIVFSMVCFYGDSLCHHFIVIQLFSKFLPQRQAKSRSNNKWQAVYLVNRTGEDPITNTLRICAIAIEWSKCLTEMKTWHLCAVTECCIMKMRLAVSTPWSLAPVWSCTCQTTVRNVGRLTICDRPFFPHNSVPSFSTKLNWLRGNYIMVRAKIATFALKVWIDDFQVLLRPQRTCHWLPYLIVWAVKVVQRRTVGSDWPFDNLSGIHLQSQLTFGNCSSLSNAEFRRL